jgi:hypothetical protein
MTPVTPEQTAEILRLSEQGLDRNLIAGRTGVTPGQVSAVRAVAARGKHQTETSSDEVIGDAIETTFVFERDLRDWLRRNIADLERGLSITDEGREARRRTSDCQRNIAHGDPR